MTEDVIVYKVDVDNQEIRSISGGLGRDTKEVAAEFCRRPKWPYKLSEHFIAVDGWGYNTGQIVAATPSLETWIGKTLAEFRSAIH